MTRTPIMEFSVRVACQNLPSKSRAIILSMLRGSPSAIVDGIKLASWCRWLAKLIVDFVLRRSNWICFRNFDYQSGIRGPYRALPPLHVQQTYKLNLNRSDGWGWLGREKWRTLYPHHERTRISFTNFKNILFEN